MLPTATASIRPLPMYPISAGLCPEPPPVTNPTFPLIGASLRAMTRSAFRMTLSRLAAAKPVSISSIMLP